jgi:hypothetical protein
MSVVCRGRSVILVVAGLLGLGLIATVALAQTSTRHEVRVPNIIHQEVGDAYGQLRRSGLRVSIPEGFVVGPMGMPVTHIQSVAPSPGSVVAPGSTVRLRVTCPTCANPITVGPSRRLPSYTLPSFIGRDLAAPQRWLAHRLLTMLVRFGPLTAASLPRLYENYRVVAQHPAPGKSLSLGIHTPGGHGNPGHFTSTPLVLRARQTSSQGWWRVAAQRGRRAWRRRRASSHAIGSAEPGVFQKTKAVGSMPGRIRSTRA